MNRSLKPLKQYIYIGNLIKRNVKKIYYKIGGDCIA